MCAHVHNCTGMWGAVGAHISVFMPAWDYMRKLRKGLKNCFPLGLFYRLLQEYLDYNPDPPTPLGCTLSLEQYNFHSMLVLGEEQELVSAGFLWWGYPENEEGNLTASLTKRWTQTILCILHLQNLLI